MTTDELQSEFDRQVENLLKLEYPVTKEMLSPLSKHLDQVTSPLNLETGSLPFVIVATEKLISLEVAMSKVLWQTKSAIIKLTPHALTDFKTIKDVSTPSSSVYMLINIDRGDQYLNITPESALKDITNAHQTPLTIIEGVALLTHFPGFLIRNHCFSLLASRKPNSQSVPAIWINASNQPNLGWCWDRNPHTWLGSAFAANRCS